MSPAHKAAIAEAVQIAEKSPNAKGFLILDMDDVIFDTRPKTHALLSRILRKRKPTTSLPTLDDARLGMRKSFEPLFNPSDPSIFAEINKVVVGRPFIFRNAPMMHEKLPEILQKITDADFIPIMCLTARNEDVMELSRKELKKAGLPDLPVFAMYPGDDDIAHMKT